MPEVVMMIPMTRDVGLTTISLGVVTAVEQLGVTAAFFKPIADDPRAQADGDRSHTTERLCGARGMIVLRDNLANALAESNIFGALRAGRQEHLWCGGVGVFLKKVMFHLPGIV